MDPGQAAEVCKILHCSADYLLRLTDDLTPVSKSDTAMLPEGAFRFAWRTDTDYPEGPIVVFVLYDDDPYAVIYNRAGRLTWDFSGKDPVPLGFVTGIQQWMPLPKLESEEPDDAD